MSIDTDKDLEIDDLPMNSFDLIDFLDRTIPHRCISLTDDLISAHRYSAQRDLVDQLLEIKNDMIERERGEDEAAD